MANRRQKRSTLEIRDVRHLCYLLKIRRDMLDKMIANSEGFYRIREKKTKGKVRTLAVPQGGLMRLQKKLNAELQKLEFPKYMQGGLKKRSNITNALHHTNRPTVLCADIKDFFPSIDATRVRDMFQERLRCSRDVADILGRLCTCSTGLPQGAPTSTIISNLVIEHLAYRLKRFAETHSAAYTQYVDDITISGPHHLEELKPLIIQIMEEEGFVCHPDKLRVVHNDEEQIVTGVRVNNGPDIPLEKLVEVQSLIACLPSNGQNAVAVRKKFASTVGKIQYASRLNRGTGRFLRKGLNRAMRYADLNVMQASEACDQGDI